MVALLPTKPPAAKTEFEKAKENLERLISLQARLQTASKGWIIEIPDTSKRKNHILKSSQYKKKNKSARNRHYRYIQNIESLVQKATYSHSKANEKQQQKPEVKEYHYFETTETVNNIEYKIIVNAEELFTTQQNFPRVLRLYDITEYKNNPGRVQTVNVC